MKKIKNIYLNIQILRMIVCFNIIIFHCMGNANQNFFIYFISRIAVFYYVPIFFFISFYFSYRAFTSKNISNIKQRLLRISIPYIIWPFIFFFYSYINKIFDRKELVYQLKDLFYQLLFGKPINPVFWFQFCLIFWTFIFSIIIFSFKSFYAYVLFFLFSIIIFVNYFNLIEIILRKYKSIYSTSIFDLFYRNIYMFSGFFFGSIDLYQSKFTTKIKFIIISLISIFIIQNKSKFYYIYIQFIINILFIFLSFLPFDSIKRRNIILVIKQITSYTGGIYYLHMQVRFNILKNSFLIKKADFISCINNYLICYSFCFIGSKIFKNTKLKYLFI